MPSSSIAAYVVTVMKRFPTTIGSYVSMYAYKKLVCTYIHRYVLTKTKYLNRAIGYMVSHYRRYFEKGV